MENLGSVFGAGYFAHRGIHNLSGLVGLLGMVLASTSTSTVSASEPPSGQPRRDDVVVDSGAIIGVGGIVLAEVIDVSVVEIDGYDPGKLYGTISITDSAGQTLHQLYNRSTWNTQSVGPGGLVDLDWPPRPILVTDGFFINVNLKDNYALRPWWDPPSGVWGGGLELRRLQQHHHRGSQAVWSRRLQCRPGEVRGVDRRRRGQRT